MEPLFSTVRRQQFRNYFQPTRIVLGLFADREQVVNPITLCFSMYCSYKPPMMSFAVHRASHSHELLTTAEECVLAVPGEALADAVMFCGTRSRKEGIDKFRACNFRAAESERVTVPGISQAIANVELRLVAKIATGDHLTAFGRVLRFAVDEQSNERPLISVGTRTRGYDVLARHGIHRIAVVKGEE